MKTEPFYIGITHRTAPLSIREMLRPHATAQRAMLADLEPLAAGRMILSTCERFELYAITADAAKCRWISRFTRWFHQPSKTIAPYIRTLRGEAAARHLLMVAAGLDSRITGEPHILGQVRGAFSQAIDARAVEPSLSALGRAAIRAGKRVRHETSIGKTDRSIVTIALDRLEQDLGSLSSRTVLIAGSGVLAAGIAEGLAARKAGQTIIAGRNLERTAALARKIGGQALCLERLGEGIARSSAVITCTAAPSFIVDTSTIGVSRTEDLHVIDLAVPRNVDPSVTLCNGVRLVHLDELVSGESPHQAATAAASRIVEEETQRFARWHRQRRVAPIIAGLVREAAMLHTDDFANINRALHTRIVHLKEATA